MKTGIVFMVMLAVFSTPTPGNANALLEEVLSVRSAKDTFQRVEIEMTRTGRPVGRRTALILRRVVNGVAYTMGELVSPPTMRGTAFLAIKGDEREDYFLYLPAFKRVRRISMHQKSDTWFGTDFSLEDIEHLRPKDFETISTQRLAINDDVYHDLTVRPTYESVFDRIVFRVHDETKFIVQADYFKDSEDQPSKTLVRRLRSVVDLDGQVLPLTVRSNRGKTSSSATVTGLRRERSLGAEWFSSSRLLKTGGPFAGIAPPATVER